MYSGISQSAVSGIITEVTEALNNPNLFNECVRFPQNVEQLNTIQQR